MIGDEQLKQLREAHAATPPGWHAGGTNDNRVYDGENLPVATFNDRHADYAQDVQNAAFAALAHQQLPALLARLDLAESALRDLQLESDAAREAIKAKAEAERLRAAMKRIVWASLVGKGMAEMITSLQRIAVEALEDVREEP